MNCVSEKRTKQNASVSDKQWWQTEQWLPNNHFPYDDWSFVKQMWLVYLWIVSHTFKIYNFIRSIKWKKNQSIRFQWNEMTGILITFVRTYSNQRSLYWCKAKIFHIRCFSTPFVSFISPKVVRIKNRWWMTKSFTRVLEIIQFSLTLTDFQVKRTQNFFNFYLK